MSIVRLDGFERLVLQPDMWDLLGGSGWTTGVGRNGGRSIVNTAGSVVAYQHLDKSPEKQATGNVTKLVAGFGFKNGMFFDVFDTGPFALATLYRLVVDVFGNLHVQNGAGTDVLVTNDPDTQILAEVWNFVEVKFDITAGTITLRINGKEVGEATGQTIPQPGSVALRGGVGAFDDFYLVDGHGAHYNDFLGDMTIFHGTPNITVLGQWTSKGGGAQHLEVDDPYPNHDGDGSYNESNVVGHMDLFKIAPSAFDPDDNAFFGIQLTVVAKKLSSGSQFLRMVVRSGGTDYLSPAVYALPADYAAFNWVVETNPATGLPWTQPQAEDAAYGYVIAPAA